MAQQTKIDSLNTILKTSKADTNRVNVLYYLSDKYSNTEPYKAIEYANQGLALSNKLAYNEGISICLNALGHAYYQIGKFDTALIYFKKRFIKVTEINDKMGIASTYDNMGIIYIHYGKMDKALELRKKANDIYSALNENIMLAGGYTWIGNIYKEQGGYSIALENYLQAIKIYESEKDDQHIGYPLLNISSIYRYMKQYGKAKKFALDAKIKFDKASNQYGVGVSLYRLAIIYSEEKDYDSAIKYLQEAEIIFKKTQNTYFLTLVDLLLGASYHNKGNNDIAIDYFEDALNTAQHIGDIELISSVYQNIGTVYYDEGDYLKALEYMLKTDKGLTGIKDKKGLMENSTSFIEIYSRLNQPDNVLKYFQRYRQLSDTIFSEQNSKSIAEMQTKYETEKKDKEILALNLKNEKKRNNIILLNTKNKITDLKLQNLTIENVKKAQALKIAKAEREQQLSKIEILKLEEMNQLKVIQNEKDKTHFIILIFIIGIIVVTIIAMLSFLSFVNKKGKEKAILSQQATELNRQAGENDMKVLRSQMNPHFIFNCVQTIERLLNESKIQASKTYLVQFSNLTRSVLENSKKREIPLSEEIETLLLYMELENLRFKNPFTFNINIAQGIDAKTTLIPPLILQPFVENSIKHGFRGTEKKGHLKIEVRINNELLLCIVEDNGIGRKLSLAIKPLSGFKKESMGIKLTEDRLRLISKIKNIQVFFLIDDLTDTFNNPTGTRVKIYLPYELSV